MKIKDLPDFNKDCLLSIKSPADVFTDRFKDGGLKAERVFSLFSFWIITCRWKRTTDAGGQGDEQQDAAGHLLPVRGDRGEESETHEVKVQSSHV